MNEQILAVLTDLPVNAAFVYGSVATGTATDTSDLDTFVLLDSAIDDSRQAEARRRFVDLQRHLGFVPDLEFPVELFTVEEVRAALCAEHLDEDALEIVRALAGTKTILRESSELHRFAAAAIVRRVG